MPPTYFGSDSGTDDEGTQPDRKTEAVDSYKERANALQERKEKAGPGDRALEGSRLTCR